MIFHWHQNTATANLDLPIALSGHPLEKVTEFKFLGVILDSNLTWNSHINQLANKLSRTIGILSRLKRILPCNVLIMIYNSLFASYINYAISAWGHGSLHRLTRLQKKAVRIITKSKYNSHSSPILKQLKLLKVEDTFKIASIKYYHKFHNNTLPTYFQDFPFKHIDTRRARRDRMLTLHYRDSQENLPVLNPIIEIMPTNKTLSRKRLRYLVPQLINQRYLPDEARDLVIIHSLYGFNNYLKNLIIDQYEDTCENPDCYVCNELLLT